MPSPSAVLSLALVVLPTFAFLLASCGRSPAPPREVATAPVAAQATPVKDPLPDLGLPREGYLDARRLQLCARKFQVADARAEAMAIALLARDPTATEVPLDPTAIVAAADPALLDRYRKAHQLADAHPSTAQWLASEVEGCVYDAQAGLVPRELVDRYAFTFAEVACLQREILGPDGKTDPLAHAHAAARVFAQHGFDAAAFARLGLVLAHYPIAQKAMFARKNARCAPKARPPANATPDRRTP